MSNAVLAVWLQNACGVASPLISKLINHYGGIDAVYKEQEYAGFDTTKAGFDNLFNKDLGEAERIVRLCNSRKIRIVTCEDGEFPQMLKSLRKMPAMLYCIGNVNLLSNTCAAIVGSRGASEIGKRSAYNLAKSLSQHGITVVSGMARGIDSAAHNGAMEGKGSTIAVLGTAIDHPYPKDNIPLYDRIAKSGLIISEIPPSQQINKWNFAERNRLISGVSELVCIGEAREGSGALITAKCACNQGKQMVCLPILPNDNFAGTANLAQDGVHVLTSLDDALGMFLHVKSPPLQNPQPEEPPVVKVCDSGIADAIIGALQSRDTLSVNQLIGILGGNSGKIMAEVTLLELSGRILRLPGDRYKINK